MMFVVIFMSMLIGFNCKAQDPLTHGLLPEVCYAGNILDPQSIVHNAHNYLVSTPELTLEQTVKVIGDTQHFERILGYELLEPLKEKIQETVHEHNNNGKEYNQKKIKQGTSLLVASTLGCLALYGIYRYWYKPMSNEYYETRETLKELGVTINTTYQHDENGKEQAVSTDYVFAGNIQPDSGDMIKECFKKLSSLKSSLGTCTLLQAVTSFGTLFCGGLALKAFYDYFSMNHSLIQQRLNMVSNVIDNVFVTDAPFGYL